MESTEAISRDGGLLPSLQTAALLRGDRREVSTKQSVAMTRKVPEMGRSRSGSQPQEAGPLGGERARLFSGDEAVRKVEEIRVT